MIIFDRVSTENKRITDEGFLEIGKARIARSGVQDYFAFELGLSDKDPLEIIKIYRPEKEVFNIDSMKSFAKKPVTNNHPSEMVTVDNVKDFQVGLSGDSVARDGDFLNTSLLIQDKQAIKDIESGKVELSNGYTSEIDFKEGKTDTGEVFDGIQKNIKGNHIALVDSARCGVNCRILDGKKEDMLFRACLNNGYGNKSAKSLDEILIGVDFNKLNTGGTMIFINIDGVDYEIPAQSKQAVENKIKTLADTITEQEETITDAKSCIDTAEKEAQKVLDEMQAKLDDAISRVPTPEMLDAIVESRLEVITIADKVIENFDAKGKDCEVIRAEVVKTKYPDLDISKKSNEYLTARFDAIAEGLERENLDSLKGDLREFANTQVIDSNKAREEMKERARNQWKKKA